MAHTTKRTLSETLKKILQEKSLDKVTVVDIVEVSAINRQTFYYHFKDIYDLVEWSCLEDAQKALKEKKTYDTWQEGLLQIFYAVRENKPFIMNVYHCVDRAQVEKYLTPLTDELLMGVIEEKSRGVQVRSEDKEFIARIFSYCFIGMMLDWIRDDMKEQPEIIVDKLALVLKDAVTNAIERMRV